jgi:hypothetical protein
MGVGEFISHSTTHSEADKLNPGHQMIKEKVQHILEVNVPSFKYILLCDS